MLSPPTEPENTASALAERRDVSVGEHTPSTPWPTTPDTTALDFGSLPGISRTTGEEHFRDDHIGSGVDPSGTRHGPYWIDRITPDTYTPASADSVIALVTRWVDQCGVIPDVLRRTLDQEVFRPARTTTRVVTLPRLDNSAVHDYGFIHTEFHEIVTIDSTHRMLRLIVAADD